MTRIPTERREPWFGDTADHPKSPLKPFYTTGRCQNPDTIVCPYCLSEHHPDHEYDTESPECEWCGMGFRVEMSFGYGYSTYANKCEHGHIWTFSGQYQHEGKNIRIHNCILCEHQDYQKLEREPLPWRDEYNDPSYFDPDGVLDTGRTIDEQIEDRLHGPGTPILDALFGDDQSWPPSTPADRARKALKIMDELEAQGE